MLAGLRFSPRLHFACKLRSRMAMGAVTATSGQMLRHGAGCAPCGAAAGASWCRRRRSFYRRCRNCMAHVAEPALARATPRGPAARWLACRLRSVLCWRAVLSIVKEMLATTGVRQVPASTRNAGLPAAAQGRVLPGPTARGSV